MITPRLVLAALAVPLAVLAGCAGEDPAGSDGTDAADPSSAADVDYPEVGLDLADAPELEGVYQQALQTYVDFERGRRLAAREGEVSRLLSFNAVADVVDPYREAFAAYDGGTYAGDVVVEFLEARPRGDVLRLGICVDATALVVPDGAPTILGEPTRSPQQVDVTNIEGLWRVTRAEPVDGSC
ncbi:hypothetical protein [Nocardioides antri]|uniref:Lipoprotein n=1 Tax=Nocardioides antri TaxID=2607659 RepID=A0A5B1M8Y9_9ACTN|nr:hypothetical protein [Nocardioides antri]KAA1428397.1 hypothetical protein F0U47_05595 [Nocardioides antri]